MVIEEPPALEPYDAHFVRASVKADPLPTGVACSDKVREKQLVTRTRTVTRTRLITKTRTVLRQQRVMTLATDPKTKEIVELPKDEIVEEEEEYEEPESYDEEVEYQEEVDVIVGDCPGEMMAHPTQTHPQYLTLHRATCSVCGWRGWA